MWSRLFNYLFSWINFKKEPEPTPAPAPIIPTPTPEPIPEPLPSVPDTIEVLLLAEHNRYRKEAGLDALKLDESLNKACAEQAKFMNDTSRITHLGRGNTTHSQRAKKHGYTSGLTAENVAMCPCEVNEVMQLWINSRGHRQNILGSFQVAGFAKSGNYWCALFGE